jgi:hypothetical protein
LELLQARRGADEELYRKSHEGEVSIEEYWEGRYFTLQVEFVWEVVKVGLGIYPLSGRAVRKYASVVGVGEASVARRRR